MTETAPPVLAPPQGSPLDPPGHRAFGVKVILGYKIAKAPLMFALAAILTFWPRLASAEVQHLAFQLSSGAAWMVRLGRWLSEHGVSGLHDIRWVAWLDGSVTTVEALLLFSGRSWGEWLVVAGVGSLIPFEIYSIDRHPRLIKVVVLVLNALVVAYLVWRRLKARALEKARAT